VAIRRVALPSLSLLFVGLFAAASGPPALHVQTCPFGPSGTSEPDGTSQFALSVTPKGSAITQLQSTNGRTSAFTVKNNGTCTDSVNVTTSASGPIAVVSVSPNYFGLLSGASQQVVVTYNVGLPGSGTLTLTANGMVIADTASGSYNVTVAPPYAVAVTPDGTPSATRSANTGGYSETFTVKNVGYYSDTYTGITCGGYVNVTCTGATPGSLTLGSQASQTVTATYSVAGAGTGRLTLSAASANASDGAWYAVPVTPVSGAPLVDQAPYNYTKQDYGLCAVACFAAVYGQSTVPYFSFDTPRSVTLAYNSDRVNPKPFVLVNVTPDLTYGQTPTEYRLQVTVKWDGVNPTFVTFLNGDQTLRFTYPGSAPVRLGAQFDASTYATNVYAMDILVSAYYASTNTLLTTDVATKLVVVNETNAPIAGGWTLAGIQRLYLQSDSAALITEGDGSAVYFAHVPSVYVSPGGEFSKLILSNLSGTNGWARIYLDSSKAVFDNTGKMVQLRDRFNNMTTVSYDGGGRVVKITDPANLADTLGYGTNGLASIKDPGSPSRTTTVTVDASRHLTAITDPDNVSTSFVFDANLLLSKLIDRRGDTTQFAYDNVSRKLTSVTSPPIQVYGVGTVTTTETQQPWQLVGVPATSTATTPAAAPLVDTVRARVVDPRGYATFYQVDPFGAITRIDDAARRTTTFARDTNSNVVRDGMPSGHVVRRAWSGANLTQVWDSTTGRTITYAYESVWNQLAQISGEADSLWNYWSVGHLDSTIAATRATGPTKRLTKFTYDTFGRQVTATDPANHADTTYYDATVWKNTDSTRAGGRRVAYTYDGHGRTATMLTPRGDVTALKYDLVNRQDSVIGPIADTTIFIYDQLFLTQVRDAIHQTYQFGVNALGWVASRTDPAGKQDQYQYDQNGNLRQWTNRRGQVIAWDPYDAVSRPTTVAADTKQTRLAYDVQDRFVVDSNAESIDTVRFDVAGRVTSQIGIRAGTRYELASHSNVRDLRDTLRTVSPWADTIAYHYNRSVALDTLRDLAGGRTAILYDRHLLDSLITLPNGLSVTRQYPATHTTSQVMYNNGTVTTAIGAKYDYDTLGLVSDRHNLASNDTIINTGRDYGHDALGRLTRYGDYTLSPPTHCEPYDPNDGWVCWGGGKTYSTQEFYSYDKVGNRTDLNAGIAAGNRLVNFNGDSLVYDDDGNLIKRIRNGQEIQRLHWNSLGQLVAVWTSGQDSVSFGYDGLGRRIAKRKAAGTTRAIYDGDELFAEVDSATGNRLAEYTYFPWIDNPHSVRVGGPTGAMYYYAQDFPGNVTGLTNSSGTLVNQYRYKPFGADAGSTESVTNSLRFAGRQYDPETGLYYMRARYYDPQLGRFASEDPIGLIGGVNGYEFAGSNPVNSNDPSGLCPCFAAAVPLAPEAAALIGIGLTATGVFLSQNFDRLQQFALNSWKWLSALKIWAWIATGHQPPRDPEPPERRVPPPSWIKPRPGGNSNPPSGGGSGEGGGGGFGGAEGGWGGMGLTSMDIQSSWVSCYPAASASVSVGDITVVGDASGDGLSSGGTTYPAGVRLDCDDGGSIWVSVFKN